MASGTGYDGALTPVVNAFDSTQRARLEAITFARKLLDHNELGRKPTLEEWLTVANYIIKGSA